MSCNLQQHFTEGRCIGMTVWCGVEGCDWFEVYPDGKAESIRAGRAAWERHSRVHARLTPGAK